MRLTPPAARIWPNCQRQSCINTFLLEAFCSHQLAERRLPKLGATVGEQCCPLGLTCLLAAPRLALAGGTRFMSAWTPRRQRRRDLCEYLRAGALSDPPSTCGDRTNQPFIFSAALPALLQPRPRKHMVDESSFDPRSSAKGSEKELAVRRSNRAPPRPAAVAFG